MRYLPLFICRFLFTAFLLFLGFYVDFTCFWVFMWVLIVSGFLGLIPLFRSDSERGIRTTGDSRSGRRGSDEEYLQRDRAVSERSILCIACGRN